MQFDFSNEQKELRSSVQRFFKDHCPISVVRSVIDAGAGLDAALWHDVAESGFLSAAIPENYGGVGAGYLELCVVAEEIGRVLAPIPSVSSIYLAAEFLMLTGSEAQKTAWLPKLASGEAIGTLALAERPGETVPKFIEARVSGGRLTGTKLPVTDGAQAHLAIVMARDEQAGLSLFLVELAGAGVERSVIKTVDPSRQHARLTFNGVAAERLGPAGQGWALLEKVRNRAAVLVAFEQIGGADRALEMARDYALERFAFGRQIGTFQAIKHMLADMYVSTALARSNAYYAAWALSANSDKLPVAAAQARVAATQAFQLCTSNNIQVHGGMGFTWEFDCHLYYRRSNYLALTLGGLSLWENQLIEGMRPIAA